MSKASLRQLYAAMAAKEGNESTSSREASLRGLRSYLVEMNNRRAHTLTSDVLTNNRNGVECVGHSSLTIPDMAKSVGEWANLMSGLKSLTCSVHTVPSLWCTCNTAVTCICNTVSDDINLCGSRTALSCECHSRNCNCQSTTSYCSGYSSYCVCDGRTGVDGCWDCSGVSDGVYCSCVGVNPCSCDSQSENLCGSRTALSCDCHSRAFPDCPSRTTETCQCKQRCTCNSVKQYS